MKWNVMPFCEAQLSDINPTDILNNGLYRKCNTYKGGGGYDKFPEIYERKYGVVKDLNNQFVVQLMGCPLKCPYCYVTPNGISGPNVQQISTEQLIEAFNDSNCKVFHLMGGAPAIYLEQWCDIIDNLDDTKIFHSDFLLIEKKYDKNVLQELSKKERTLYAVSIKGADSKEFFNNTRVKFNKHLFWRNLDLLVEYNIPFYLTYTGMTEDSIKSFKKLVMNRYGSQGEQVLHYSFAINLIHYNALDYINDYA